MDDSEKEVWCQQCLGRTSKSEEHSLKSQINLSMDEVEGKLQMTSPNRDKTLDDCVCDFSKSSRKSLDNKGNNVSVPKLSWMNTMTQIVGLAAAWHHGKVEADPVGTNIAGSSKVNKKPVHAEFNFFL